MALLQRSSCALVLCAILTPSVFAQKKTSPAPIAPRPMAKKNYADVFRDFYDLATPHNRSEEISFATGLQFSSFIPFGRMGATGSVPAIYATFFNIQAKGMARFFYHLETFLLTGFDTISLDVPLTSSGYHIVSFDSVPVLFGAKWRMLRGDFVPYLSVATGFHYVMMSVYEESTAKAADASKLAPAYQITVGMDLYFDTHFGFGFEVGLEQVLHGAVSLDNGFSNGPFAFGSTSGGLLLASSFFYEF